MRNLTKTELQLAVDWLDDFDRLQSRRSKEVKDVQRGSAGRFRRSSTDPSGEVLPRSLLRRRRAQDVVNIAPESSCVRSVRSGIGWLSFGSGQTPVSLRGLPPAH